MATSKSGVVRKNKKLVVVGDGMCGKTCLLLAFKDDRFNPTHDATIFDTYVADIQVDGKIVSDVEGIRGSRCFACRLIWPFSIRQARKTSIAFVRFAMPILASCSCVSASIVPCPRRVPLKSGCPKCDISVADVQSFWSAARKT